MEKVKKIFMVLFRIILICCLIMAINFLYVLNYIPHRKYTNEDFGIETFISSVDKDGDGIDDQSDMLQSVKDYLATKPKYQSKYYGTGYPDDEYGVCTDVVAFGMLNAGYDLMSLVYDDVWANREMYDIEIVDINIDFRRVQNLQVFFKNNFISLTTDIYDIESWQPGDIVIFERHIGVISEYRNKKGIPFVYHNGNPYQADYLEDILEYYDNIIGHYRLSQ
ncbi:MAG: DUF1287 domain-containing protein [Bacillota bacterium]|jgi:uncharacterized protein YijF (DUF1287 family)|nr:DUF1287 domain-containing protein [Bacillota bacterium]NLL26141.1 DUF1287 domain-containing protein [Erysipelotrichia bacterium]